MKNQLETIALFGTLTASLMGFGALIAPGYLYPPFRHSLSTEGI